MRPFLHLVVLFQMVLLSSHCRFDILSDDLTERRLKCVRIGHLDRVAPKNHSARAVGDLRSCQV